MPTIAEQAAAAAADPAAAELMARIAARVEWRRHHVPKETPADPDALLDAPEVARLLKVSPETVWALSRAGNIPTVKLGPRTLRYRRGSIAEWIAALEAESLK